MSMPPKPTTLIPPSPNEGTSNLVALYCHGSTMTTMMRLVVILLVVMVMTMMMVTTTGNARDGDVADDQE